ncbi:MAG: SDR family oxidoreductase [Rhodospirillales bacterium]|jgi:NAD(P)-dependent dehydrogenase (short-subunit alcohol dehydrogenase family)|nr:SDR family oxidoreductase [Rhodospirillales bacterium]MBT7942160.1 SDR family oxidoreductase [Alphaproteobacteria bacterium]
MRLNDKTAIIFGAGQAPGETPAIGNGRAVSVLFAREGAKILCVDRHLDSAEETADVIRGEGSEAHAVAADVTDEDQVKAAVDSCVEHWGRIDILHNNVGISVEGGDAPVTEITTEAFDKIVAVNLRSMVYACKHTIPVMRQQKSGSIVSISSMAAWEDYPWVSYKATKSAMIALTQQFAIQNAEYGIRANVILPGLMDTPMAVDRRAEAWDRPREEVAAERDAKIPLLGKMGDAWDVAFAALFLASDEAKFITGAALPVDGGRGLRVG